MGDGTPPKFFKKNSPKGIDRAYVRCYDFFRCRTILEPDGLYSMGLHAASDVLSHKEIVAVEGELLSLHDTK